MGPATWSGPAGNLSTIPEQEAEMEVHYGLHEVPGQQTWSFSGPGWELRASEARVESLLADSASPPLSRGAVRHPQPGKFPTESRGVFHADRLSSGGSGTPLFPGRGCGVGGMSHFPGYALVSVSLASVSLSLR